jgi:hypothetical protein
VHEFLLAFGDEPEEVFKLKAATTSVPRSDRRVVGFRPTPADRRKLDRLAALTGMKVGALGRLAMHEFLVAGYTVSVRRPTSWTVIERYHF